MRLFDSHCHLDNPHFEKDRDRVLARAASAGVKRMMVVGTGPADASKVVQLATSHENILASVGIHPHNAKFRKKGSLTALKRLAQNPKVHAWGEIGLDFNRLFSPQTTQERCFVEQLELAWDLNLPVILHERDSHGRFLKILQNHFKPGMKGVVHCFSGSSNELKQYLKIGLYIGITGIVTLKSRGAPLRKMIPNIPTERIMIETDAPYLTPAPEKNRIRRNEPAFVKSVLMKLAAICQTDPDDLAERVWQNTCRLYQLEKATGTFSSLPD